MLEVGLKMDHKWSSTAHTIISALFSVSLCFVSLSPIKYKKGK